MNDFEDVKTILKPFRYTKKGKVTILESTSGNFVVKEKSKNLQDIFSYLRSRDFNYFPRVLNNYRSDINVYEYLEDATTIYPQKSEDLIKLVSLLHSKTSYYKEVSEEVYKEIFENIENNINYYKNYYLTYYELFLKSHYMSPSEYEFSRNYSKIMACLGFADRELHSWYSLVSNSSKERVALIHNNLALEHFIRTEDNSYLISWDKSKFDSPVLDLVNLYQKEYFNLEFSSVFETYMNLSPLNESEKKLFFTLISLPPDLKFEGSEFEKTKDIRKFLDYTYKTEKFLTPYYTGDTPEE